MYSLCGTSNGTNLRERSGIGPIGANRTDYGSLSVLQVRITGQFLSDPGSAPGLLAQGCVQSIVIGRISRLTSPGTMFVENPVTVSIRLVEVMVWKTVSVGDGTQAMAGCRAFHQKQVLRYLGHRQVRLLYAVVLRS